MQKINHPILPALEEFLRIPCKDLALLIDGPWGCGKTFFLRHLFKKEWQGKKIIYISLKGISSLEDIAQKISLQIAMCKLPEQEKISKYLSKFPILKALQNIDIPYLNTSGLVQCLDESIIAGSDFMKYIFIFDDLERLPNHIAYENCLFYIHSLLLEDRFANVIVVTDKKHLITDDASSEKYKQVANKVFYRELPFRQNIKDIFSEYLHTRYPNISQDLSANLLKSTAMQDIFQKNTTQNLRYYNQFFDALLAVYTYFAKISFPMDEIRHNILEELLVKLWHEYIFLKVTPPSSEIEFIYPFTDFSVFPYEYSFVHQFCVEGILNVHQMQEEISKRLIYYIQRVPIDESLSKLNHFADYPYKEVKEALDSILSVYLSLSDIDLLLDIYRCFVFLQNVGLINNTQYRKLVSRLRSYIRKMVFKKLDVNLLNRSQVSHLLYSADKEIYDFWNGLYNEYQKHLEQYYINLFLKRNFANSDLLQYCESATPQQRNALWEALFVNRNKLVKKGKFAGFVRFMIKHLKYLDVKHREAEIFIKICLTRSELPSEVESLRQWILQFIAKWNSANYKKYAAMLRKRNLILLRRMEKQKKSSR